MKEVKKYESTITIVKDAKTAAATKLMAVMGFGVKCGDTVEVEVQGADERLLVQNKGIFCRRICKQISMCSVRPAGFPWNWHIIVP